MTKLCYVEHGPNSDPVTVFLLLLLVMSWAAWWSEGAVWLSQTDSVCIITKSKFHSGPRRGKKLDSLAWLHANCLKKTPRLQSDIEQISTGSLRRWRRRAMATPLLLPALPTELSLCWFVFHKSNADILLSANCRLIHGWRCTETQEDFNNVFWLSQLRCRGGKKPQRTSDWKASAVFVWSRRKS